MKNGWEKMSLGSIVEIASGQVDPRRSPYRDMIHVGGDNIESNTGKLLNLKTAAEQGLISGKYQFDQRDVLYSKIRPALNKVVAPTFEGICSADIYPLRPIEGKLCRDFLVHLLRSSDFLEYTATCSSRTNIPKINREALFAYQAIFPPLSEQRRIAAILDKADAIRRKREEGIRLTEELLRSTFLDMFGDLSSNPKGWPLVELGDLIADGPQNGLYRPSTDYGSGIRIVRIDGFRGGDHLTPNLVEKRVHIDEATQRLYQLRDGDLLINRVNSRSHLGKAAVIYDLHEPVVFESNMMRLSLKSDRALPQYVLSCLGHPSVIRQIQTAAKDAVNQASINQTDVRAIRLPLPLLSVQKKFSAFFTEVRVATKKRLESNAAQELLFASLVQRAFRGEL